jgi:hypothetical protein
MELKTIADGYFNEVENNVSVDVSDLAIGIYLIAIRYVGGIAAEKMLVTR